MIIQALNPASARFCQEEALFPFASIFEYNIDQMKIILEKKLKSVIQMPSSIVDLTTNIELFKFHEFFRLCKIAIAMPLSTAASECSFSTLKVVKTYLRSSRDDKRLSNLGFKCGV